MKKTNFVFKNISKNWIMVSVSLVLLFAFGIFVNKFSSASSEILNATQITLDQILFSTLISDKQTRIVQLTAETPQPPSGISITREPGLIQGDVAPLLAPNMEITGSWLDPLEGRFTIIYYAGAIKNTGQGAIAVFENKTYSVREFVTVEVTGKLTISGKKGDILILEMEKSGTIFFSTRTNQFLSSNSNANLIPMATNMPTSIPRSRSTSYPSNPYP